MKWDSPRRTLADKDGSILQARPASLATPRGKDTVRLRLIDDADRVAEGVFEVDGLVELVAQVKGWSVPAKKE